MQPHVTKYFVNGEEETTDQDELTVTAILENAGFTPATDYSLTSENPKHTYTDYSEKVKVHNNQRFAAQFKGPTPTS
jgi:hypothetical protein